MFNGVNGTNGHDHDQADYASGEEHNGGSGDGTDSISNLAGDLIEFTPADFPEHFQQRGARLFHSQGNAPWPLPADTPEQERLNRQHNVLHGVVGSNYVGPVQEVLEHVPNRTKYVVDLGTGTGKWVLEMAREFPHVRFDGLDIVPIATQYPPDNVDFVITDVTQRTQYTDQSTDVVHARLISLGIRNYPALIAEAARILVPGGLFLSGEWAREAVLDSGGDPPTDCPGACAFYAAVNHALALVGVPRVEGRVDVLLEQNGRFEAIETREYRVPIGDWHTEPAMQNIGRIQRAVVMRYVGGLEEFLRSTGMSQSEYDRLAQAYLREAENVPGMVSVYHTVHARKV